jgi:hypothetical protein
MLDSGSSVSFVRREVLDEIDNLGLPYKLETTGERCQAANGEPCNIMKAVVMTVKLHGFAWKVRFLIFEQCPVPSVLGLYFLGRARLRMNFATGTYSFAFRPEKEFKFQ